MKLNFRKYGSGDPLLILHGVFGSSDNWQTVGKDLSEHFTVYLIDQRNHGNSPHDTEMNYEVMAEDLKELMEDENIISSHVMGHSMGGKTAMHFATHYPELVKKLIVVDIAPKFYPPHHQQIFKAYRSVALEKLDSRKEADQKVSEIIKDFGVRQFILKNLNRDSENQYSWKINLDALEAHIDRIGEGLPDVAQFDKPTLFIGGKKSNYIQSDDELIIQKHFSDYQIEMVDGAGHWVHAEKPKELLTLVLNFLS